MEKSTFTLEAAPETPKCYLVLRIRKAVDQSDFSYSAVCYEYGIYSTESQALDAVIQLMERNLVKLNLQDKLNYFLKTIKSCLTFGELNSFLQLERNTVLKTGRVIYFGYERMSKDETPNMFGYHNHNQNSIGYYLYDAIEFYLDSTPEIEF